MLVLALLLASLVGLSLGMLGGGGSILTTPILHYVLGLSEKQAIAMSFPVVGLTSLVGAAGHSRAGRLDLRTALGFGAVSFASSYSAGRMARHVPGAVQLALLATLMLVTASLMLRSAARTAPDAPGAPDAEVARPAGKRWLIFVVALGVGLVTGTVGIGGGFLFVPALALLGGLPMRTAVGTSTLVIALNTLGGFLAYHGEVHMRWDIVAMITAVAIVGILVGTRLVARVPQRTLKRAFALFLVVVGALILVDKSAKLMAARRAPSPTSPAARLPHA